MYILGSVLGLARLYLHLQSPLDHTRVELALAGKTLFLSETGQDALPLEGSEELGLIGPVVNHPNGRNGNDNGEEAFNDELDVSVIVAMTHNPSPSRVSTNTGHLRNGVTKDTTESAGKHSTGEENGHSSVEFLSAVPSGKEEVESGELHQHRKRA